MPQLLDIPVKAPKAMLADKGYDSDAVRETLLLHNFYRSSHPRQTAANRRQRLSALPRPQPGERLFNRLKQFRRIATRYDKTVTSFLGLLCLAAVRSGYRTMSTGLRRDRSISDVT